MTEQPMQALLHPDEELVPMPAQRYDLVTKLGAGGMAEVFLGWVNSVGGIRRRVAIKRILPDLARRQRDLFEKMLVDEARLAFVLEHDNIVRVYDIGQSANTFFIVMEYVEGMDLKRIFDMLRERKQLMSLDNAIYIGASIAAGLAYAHTYTDVDGGELSIVHNDISPPNVLIGRAGEVKIADFGLADAQIHRVETPAGMVKGKIAYLSPEATRDPSLVTARSDIFSLGIVLWELVAGQRLFLRKDDKTSLFAVRECKVPNVKDIRPDTPRRLVEIINTALDQNPETRYHTAEALFNDLVNLAYQLRIPASRSGLSRLVHDLKGAPKAGFEGELVTDEEAAAILNELDGMLPPGVAEHLAGFVTNARIEENTWGDGSQPDIAVGENFFGSLYEEVGFDASDVFGDRTGAMRAVSDQTGRTRALGDVTGRHRAIGDVVAVNRKTGAVRAVPGLLTGAGRAVTGNTRGQHGPDRSLIQPDPTASPHADTVDVELPTRTIAKTSPVHLIFSLLVGLAIGVLVGMIL